MTLYGPDVSSHQPNSDWSAVKSAGNGFGISKATQGTGYTNPYVGHDLAGLRAAQMFWGAYHFATPKTASAAAEADHYADVVAAHGGLTGTQSLQPILDLEGGYIAGYGASALTQWALAWFERVHQRLGTEGGIVYANFYDARDQMNGSRLAPAGIRLWLAAYTTSVATCPPGWPSFAMQQYTDHATILGIAGPCDRSIIRADITPLLNRPSVPQQVWSRPVTVDGQTFNTHVNYWVTVGPGQQYWQAVIAIQHALNSYNAPTGLGPLKLDGQFGPTTEAKVRAFQHWKGLTVDGVVGAATAVALGLTTP